MGLPDRRLGRQRGDRDAFVGYTTVVWPGLADSSLAMALLAVGAIWLLTFVNILGVREGGWVQVVTTVLKFVPSP